jgi:hypothetical protein
MGESSATPTSKVHVVVLSYGGWCDMLPMWLVANRSHMSSLTVTNKMDVTCARNTAARLACQSGADWLLMVNGDCCPLCTLPDLFKMLGGFRVGASHKEGPGGERHADGQSLDTACMVVSTEVLRMVYSPDWGWFPRPIVGADGCDWTACECTTFSNLLAARGISFTHLPVWVSHTHRAEFTGVGKEAVK